MRSDEDRQGTVDALERLRADGADLSIPHDIDPQFLDLSSPRAYDGLDFEWNPNLPIFFSKGY